MPAPAWRSPWRLLQHAALAFGLAFASSMSHAQYKTRSFHDDFSTGALSSAWQVANWRNGPPFGCAFSPQAVSLREEDLALGFSGGKGLKTGTANGSCAEVRTLQKWLYGRYEVDMKPAGVAGTVSSFFLYSGRAGTPTHFEIDIEFDGDNGRLHSNVWLAGQQDQHDIDLRALGIDPYAASRRYAFFWQPDAVSWEVMDDAGRWIEVRRVAVAINVPMQLMMNAWYGNNSTDALLFPGFYDGTAGQAIYRSVAIWQ